MKFETPTGLKGEAKVFLGRAMREALRLHRESEQDAKKKKKFSFWSYLITSCIDFEAWGIYRAVTVPEKLYSGDRVLLVRAICEATYGPKYQFPFQCRACGKKQRWEIPLGDLEPIPFNPEHKKILAGGKNEFPADVPGVGPVVWSYSTGETEGATQSAMANGDVFEVLAQRIMSIGDAHGHDDVLAYLEEKSIEVSDKLLSVMDEYSFGINNRIEVRCTSKDCGLVQTVILPFDASLFMPQTGGKYSL